MGTTQSCPHQLAPMIKPRLQLPLWGHTIHLVLWLFQLLPKGLYLSLDEFQLLLGHSEWQGAKQQFERQYVLKTCMLQFLFLGQCRVSEWVKLQFPSFPWGEKKLDLVFQVYWLLLGGLASIFPISGYWQYLVYYSTLEASKNKDSGLAGHKNLRGSQTLVRLTGEINL